MSKKEQKIQERAFELLCLHEEWSEWKAVAAAVAEEMRLQRVRKYGRPRARMVGLLEVCE